MDTGLMSVGIKAVMKRISASRSSGNLNLDNCGVSEVPKAAWDVTEEIDGCTQPWWTVEVVKSVSLQNNQLTTLPPELFNLADLQILNASGNALRAIPDCVSALRQLKVLAVARNQISELSEAVADLGALVKLDCSENASLCSLPSQLGAQQPLLSDLTVRKCNLSNFPTALSQARGLRNLDLASNALSSLSKSSLQGFTSLTALDLSHNQLCTLPATIFSTCTGIVSLSMSNNRLKELPASIGRCKALVTLSLSHNHLRTLPPELAFCPVLAELSLRDNCLTDIGSGVPRLQSLRLLDLTNNELTSLPSTLGHVTNLRAMPLNGNPMRAIPHNIRTGAISKLLEYLRMQDRDTTAPGKSTQPREASGSFGAVGALRDDSAGVLASNAARQLAISAEAKSEAQVQSSVVLVHGPGGGQHVRGVGGGGWSQQALNVSNLGLSELPDDIFSAGTASNTPQRFHLDRLGHVDKVAISAAGAAVSSLDASGNSLSVVAHQQLSQLSCLTSVNLSKNCLAGWPIPHETPNKLPYLAELNLQQNRTLPALPPTAFSGCAGSLTHLTLSGCAKACQRLESLSACTALKHLDLSHCSLPAFPDSLSQCTALTSLLLSNNSITAIPIPLVSGLEQLEVLDVTNNSLTMLPPEIALLPRLRSFSVEGNILRTLRRTVLNGGSSALLDYLRSRIPA